MFALPTALQEFRSIARRPRTYVTRVVWLLLLLLLLGLLLSGVFRTNILTANEAARVAQFLARLVLLAQAVSLYLLTPAVAAGMVAEDRQRRILTLILATPLTSASILAGKLLARCAEVAGILLIAFPVLALVSLLGGVDLVELAAFELVLLINTLYIACLSMLVGLGARNARSAVMSIYLLWAGLIVGPLILESLNLRLPSPPPPLDLWCAAVRPDAPLIHSFQTILQANVTTVDQWLPPLLVVPLGLAAGCFLIAVSRLRSISAQVDGDRRARLGGGKSPIHSRATRWLDDHPVFWKEISPTRRISRKLMHIFPWLLVFGLFAWFLAPRMLLLPWYNTSVNTSEVLGICIVTIVMLGFFTAVGVLASALGSITGEKERDSWVSLRATPLELRQIVVEKAAATIWNYRWWIALILCSMVIAAGVRPALLFTVPSMLITLASDLIFSAALGLMISSRHDSTARALTHGLLLYCGRSFLMPFACIFAVAGMGSPGSQDLYLFLFMLFAPITCQPMLLSFADRISDTTPTTCIAAFVSAIAWLGIAVVLLNLTLERMRRTSSAATP
jgi:ABC-type transport system involved in multi-copper enzyme maturation permease subunit